MHSPHVVVVGAGPGGLATALQCAQAGARVTLLEKQDRVGGRTSSLLRNGFRFDLGPTFFLYPRILSEIFRSLGRDLQRDVPMTRLDPMYRLSFGAGGAIEATQDIDRMEAQVAALSPADRGSLTKYMIENRTKLEKFRPILESPFSSPFDLLRSGVLSAAPYLRPWKSLGGELRNYFRDPRLVIAFSFQAKYLGMSPFRCPSLFSILSFLEYEHGVFHPTGGCGHLSEVMAGIATSMGVDVRLGEAVTGFDFKFRRPIAVRTTSGRYPCDAVVINADFANAMTRLVPNSLRRRWTDKRINRKKFSCSTFMLYLGIRGSYQHLPHHSVHIASDYEQNLREIERDRILPKDPSFYVQNACVTDPRLAPDGHSTLYVLVPVPHQNPNVTWNQNTRQQFRSLTLERLRAIGIEDIERNIVSETMVTPADWQSQYDIFRGATFNLAHSLSQMLHLRPHNQFEDLERVYLVGGGTHPGSGLPVIFESSRITCKQLLPKLGLSCQFIVEANAAKEKSNARSFL